MAKAEITPTRRVGTRAHVARSFAPRKNNSPPTAASPTPKIKAKAKAPGFTVGPLSRCGR